VPPPGEVGSGSFSQFRVEPSGRFPSHGVAFSSSFASSNAVSGSTGARVIVRGHRSIGGAEMTAGELSPFFHPFRRGVLG
jgi:hypothetical protein